MKVLHIRRESNRIVLTVDPHRQYAPLIVFVGAAGAVDIHVEDIRVAHIYRELAGNPSASLRFREDCDLPGVPCVRLCPEFATRLNKALANKDRFFKAKDLHDLLLPSSNTSHPNSDDYKIGEWCGEIEHLVDIAEDNALVTA